MKRTIEKELDVDLVEELAKKILGTLDGNQLLEVLFAVANVLVRVHVEQDLDIEMAVDAIRKMHAQALEEHVNQNEIH
jgi:hypothetical protein